MAKMVDLTEQVFGRWTVIERVANRYKSKDYWLCRCECGTVREVAGYHLRIGSSQSCGCLAHELSANRRLLPKGQAAFNMVYQNYIHHAKARDLVFELTKEDVSLLTKMNCHYCGAEPSQVSTRPEANGDYIYNGIDRMDNTKGYAMDNVVPCCGRCNYWKGTMNTSEFINHANMIANHRG